MNLLKGLLGATGDRGYRAHVLTDGDLGVKAEQVVRLTPTDPAGWHEGSYAGVPVNETSVLALSAVWACVNLLAGTIASLPLMVYRQKGGDRVEARDHPLYTLLHDSPNYDQTAMDFWEGGELGLELQGNMFARKVMNASRTRLIALEPFFNPSIRRTSSGGLMYRWTQDGLSYDLPQEDVFHVRGFGGGKLGGMSTLSAGRQVFGLSTAVNVAAQATFANGIRPSGAISFKDFVPPEKRGLLEDKIVEKFAGAMNAGRPMVLEGGATWTQITLKPEDAQMLQSRGFSVEEVCRLFGVPPIMIGHGEKTSSWGTGVQEVTLGFIKYTLRRRLKRIEQAITKQLLTPADRAVGITVEFNLEGLLRGDSEGRAKFYEIMVRMGVMTINECRALENLPPVPGGDEPRVQMQNVPLTQMGHNGGPPLQE